MANIGKTVRESEIEEPNYVPDEEPSTAPELEPAAHFDGDYAEVHYDRARDGYVVNSKFIPANEVRAASGKLISAAYEANLVRKFEFGGMVIPVRTDPLMPEGMFRLQVT